MEPSNDQDTPEKREAARRNATERRGAATKDYNDRQFIFREHETGQEAFIIKSGRVEIFKTVTQDSITQEISLGILPPGTMFGEMALIDNKPRMASARAYKGAVTLLVVSQKQFSAMLDPVNPFVKKLLEILANHVRASNTANQVSNTSEPSPDDLPKPPDDESRETSEDPQKDPSVAAEET